MFRSHRGALALLLGAVCFSAACKRNDAADNAGTTRDTSASARRDSAAMRHDSMTDGVIAGIVMTANTNDSAGGAMARTRATSAAVRNFAAKMVREHGAANHDGAALMQRLTAGGMAMQHEDIRKMRDDAQSWSNDIMRDSGQTFDRHYMDHEVDGHQNVLNKIDHDLIPHAQDADLKAMLTRARTMVNDHLTEARRIKDGLH
jgi:putative membrane protein